MRNKENENRVLEDVRIVFRNFSGKEGRYNREGARNFCVLLDQDIATEMESEGWNIKYLKPRDENEEPQAYIKVAIRFGRVPQRIFLVNNHGKFLLTEDTISILDWADIQTVDLIIRPYDTEINGAAFRKAYVQSMYVTIREDELTEKYYDIPDSAMNSMIQQ